MYPRPGLSLQHLYDVRMRPSMGGYPFTCLRGQQQPAGRRHTAVRAPAGRPGTHTPMTAADHELRAGRLARSVPSPLTVAALCAATMLAAPIHARCAACSLSDRRRRRALSLRCSWRRETTTREIRSNAAAASVTRPCRRPGRRSSR